MYKKFPVIVAITFIIAFAAVVSGCTNPGHLVTNTVNPGTVGENSTVYVTLNPTPVPTVVIPPTESVSGNTITIKGYQDNTATGIQLNQGVYVVQSSGDGSALTATLVDSGYNGIALLNTGSTSGKKLVVVNDISVFAGNATLEVTSDGSWTVTIAQQEADYATSLPQEMSGDSSSELVSAPFKASAGNIVISYTLSMTPLQDSYVNIYNIVNGQTFYVFPLKKNAQEGQITAIVPSDGVYIAEIDLPAGSSYGDITISQD